MASSALPPPSAVEIEAIAESGQLVTPASFAVNPGGSEALTVLMSCSVSWRLRLKTKGE
ncbi:hypothetical protein D3C83_242530 [compost metagenome]